MFAVSADNSTCVNRTLQWRWLGTQKFSNASVIDLQKKETARASIEYVELLKKKKAEYPSYRKARERMQELMKAQKNVEMFFADNRSEQEQQQTR